CREYAVEEGIDVLVEVVRVDGADDGGVHVGMADGEAEDELLARHAVQEVAEVDGLPLVPEVALFFTGAAFGRAAADDDTGAGLAGGNNEVFVLALHGGVGDLELVKDAHFDVV